MNYQVGKQYWRVKDDGGIYSFYIAKAVREIRGESEKNTFFVDNYYDEKDNKVLSDSPNTPPTIMPMINLIFDDECKAIDFSIERLQKRKMNLTNEKEWGNESGK